MDSTTTLNEGTLIIDYQQRSKGVVLAEKDLITFATVAHCGVIHY